MGKWWLVAKYEYLTNIRRRSFLLTAFGLPLFITVIMLVVIAVSTQDQGLTLEEIDTVGYVDTVGFLEAPVEKPEFFRAYESEDSAQADLDAEQIGAYFVVESDYMNSGKVRLIAHGNAEDALREEIDNFLLANLRAANDLDVSMDRLQNPVNETIFLENNGRSYSEEGLFITVFLLPFIVSIVFVMAMQISSGFLMSGVVEEKSSHVIEILMSSITPLQILLGKLLGMGALGLTQLLIWLVMGFGVTQLSNQLPIPQIEIPLELMVVAVIYFIFTYFLLASILAGVGAIVSGEQESRQYAGIISLAMFIPIFLLAQIIEDPNSTLAVILSMVPVTSAVTMILRLSLGTVALVELLLSIGILILVTGGIVWVSAKVFRWATLLYGKKVTIPELWRVIRGSPEAGVLMSSVAQEEARA